MTTPTSAKQSKVGRASDAICWIGLAASPTFALMGLLSATDASRIALCAAAPDMRPIGGMAWMYLLMSLFHVSPWLKLAFDRPRQPIPPTHQN